MKMYILVRKDLNWSNRMVQVAHAIAEFILRFCQDEGVQRWNETTQTMVLLGVENEAELLEWKSRFGINQCHLCREPDLADQATALVVHPQIDPEIFKDVKILR